MNYRRVAAKSMYAASMNIVVFFSMTAMVVPSKKTTRSARSFTVNARDVVDKATDQQQGYIDRPIAQDIVYLARVVSKHERKKGQLYPNDEKKSAASSSSSNSSSSSYDDDSSATTPITASSTTPKKISIFDRPVQRSDFGKKLDARKQQEQEKQQQLSKKIAVKAKRDMNKARKKSENDQKRAQEIMLYSARAKVKFDAIDAFNLEESYTPEQKKQKKSNTAAPQFSRICKTTDLSPIVFDVGADAGLESSSSENSFELPVVNNSFSDDSSTEKENNYSRKPLPYSAKKPMLLRKDDSKLGRMHDRLQIAESNLEYVGKLDLYRHKKELKKDINKRG